MPLALFSFACDGSSTHFISSLHWNHIIIKHNLITEEAETDTSAEWTVLPTPSKPAQSASRQTSQQAPSTHRPTEQSSQPASAKTDTAGQHTNLLSTVVKKSIPHTVTQASFESSSQSSVSSAASNTHQKTSAAAADTRRIARVTPMSHTLTVCYIIYSSLAFINPVFLVVDSQCIILKNLPNSMTT